MKKILAFLPLLLVPALLAAQTGKTLSVEADWYKDAKYNYLITKVNQQFRNGELITEYNTVYQAGMEIIDSTGSFYKIKWNIPTAAVRFDENQDVNTILNKEIANPITQIIYRTSSKGVFEHIENIDEIINVIRIAAAKALKEGTEGFVEYDELISSSLFSFISDGPDKEKLLLRLSEEIRAVHYPFGNQFPLNGRIDFTEEVKNVLGGEDFLCTGHITLENVDFDLNYCVISRELSLEETESKTALMNYFSQMALDKDKISEYINRSKISVFEDNVYEYLYQPGIVLSIEKNKTIKIDLLDEVSLYIDELFIQSLDDHDLNIGE